MSSDHVSWIVVLYIIQNLSHNGCTIEVTNLYHNHHDASPSDSNNPLAQRGNNVWIHCHDDADNDNDMDNKIVVAAFAYSKNERRQRLLLQQL